MPKKLGENSKAVEARARKADSKAKKESTKEKQEEDEVWAAAGEGAKSKAQAKKDEQAKQREEAATKKAEAKRLAAEEDAAMAKAAKPKAAAPKVTQHQLKQQQEARRKEEELAQREQHMASVKREMPEERYEQLVATPNVNRADAGTVEARNLDDALNALQVGGEVPEDKHPERRMKAAFAAYTEREMPALRQERPGLKLSQYKDIIWKNWQKAPENLMAQRGTPGK